MPSFRRTNALLDGMRDGSIRNRNRKAFKPSVIRTYETWIEARLREPFGLLRLTDVHRNDLQDFVEELVAEGRDASTIRNILMPLRVLYRRAIQRGEVAVSPLDYLELPAVEGARERVADPAEAQRLLDALTDEDRALWATALYAGLRNGELRALRVEEVDLEAGRLRVEHSWDSAAGLVEPKSASGVRTIPICDRLRAYLEPRLARRQSGFVFGETAERPYNYNATTRRASKAGKDAELERLTLHNARHSFRTYLDYAGISEARCDRYMGHSDGRIGRRYTHAFERHFALDAQLLDAYLEGAVAGLVVPLAVSA